MPDESFGEKTEQPTPRRQQEAREKGQVARSQDLSHAVLLLVAFGALWYLGPPLMGELMALHVQVFQHLGDAELDPVNAVGYASRGLALLTRMVLPFALVLFVAALLVNLLQVGFVFAVDPLMPDIAKLDPIKGFTRIFSLRAMVRLAASILKILVISAVLWAGMSGELGHLFGLMDTGVSAILGYTNRAIWDVGMQAAAAVLVLALLDLSYQRWQFQQEIRMSKEEVKDELKRMEGDPKIRERRRALARQLVMKRMMARVKEAEVVVTNPTHYAVALAYEPERMEAPVVVAKGRDLVALRIRDLALEHRIPIVEKPPLARALHDACEPGQEVPPQLYQAVAEVLAYVWELGQGRRQTA
ncbi:MAG: flagellar biosynthesis protein FlhB [Planctomycetes bacterium]|nr:flagellar biosynthesis protein FlhB [Planctomycetota bacterium]